MRFMRLDLRSALALDSQARP
jgi:hypothetical protein